MTAPSWANRIMWTGDNLHIVRGMNAEPAILSFLDPPFNSSRNQAAPPGSGTGGVAFNYT